MKVTVTDKYSEYSENNSSASLTIIDNATCDGTDRNDCGAETSTFVMTVDCK